MNPTVTLHENTKTNNTVKFKELESLLDFPIFHLNTGTTDLSALKEFVTNLPEIEFYGVLIETNHQQNQIIKAWELLFSSVRLKTLTNRLSRVFGPILGYYGIYPQIHNPVAIYQLDSHAETYANEYILPTVKGLKGILCKGIMHITTYHPSTAGIVFVFAKI
jgi:hypothetical protein